MCASLHLSACLLPHVIPFRRLTLQVGFRTASEGEFVQMCSTLDDQGLLRVAGGGAPRRRRVTLAVQEDDVLLALREVRVLRNLLD